MKILEFSNLLRQRNLYCLCVMLLILLLFVGCSPITYPEGMGSESIGAGPVVMQSTPQETVFSYFEAMNSGDIELMSQLVDPENESNQIFLKGFEEGLNQGLRIEVTDVSLYVVEETADLVRIQANHRQKMTDDDKVVFDTESGSSFTLVRKGDEWYFIGLGDPIPPGWLID